MIRIALAERMNHDRCLSPLGSFPEKTDFIEIDMSRVKFVESSGLVALGVALEVWTSNGTFCSLKRPISANVANYLDRVDVSFLCERLGVHHDLPIVKKNRNLDGQALVPLTRFDSLEGLLAMLKIIGSRIHDNDLKDIIGVMFSEAASNALDHSGVHGGFVAAQYFPSISSLTLAIADSGVGLLGTLGPMGARSDEEAIEMAFEGVTSRPYGRGGAGIRAIRERLAACEGQGWISSGAAMVDLRSAVRHRTATELLAGTSIHVRVPIQRLESAGP